MKSPLIAPLISDAAASLACAKCHLKAGTEKDFVYVGGFPAAVALEGYYLFLLDR